MNFKTVLFLVLSLPVVNVFAQESPLSNNVANKTNDAEVVFDYTTCSAFFAILANRMSESSASKARLNRMSEKMLDYAISLPSDGYMDMDDEETASKIQAAMQRSEADAKRVVRLYVPHCKKLLKKISDGTVG